MKKVKARLNTVFVPQVAEGAFENHYGVPFCATDSGEKDAKGNPVLILIAELDEQDAKAMEAVGRVEIIDAPAEKAKPADPPK